MMPSILIDDTGNRGSFEAPFTAIAEIKVKNVAIKIVVQSPLEAQYGSLFSFGL
jgi:hypothetical protein